MTTTNLVCIAVGAIFAIPTWEWLKAQIHNFRVRREQRLLDKPFRGRVIKSA